MSGRLGLEFTPTQVRGIVATSWSDRPARTFELAWDPDRPQAVVDALRGQVASPDAIFVAIGLGFLHLSRVQLPPSGDESRERMVRLEPERFFAATALVRPSLAAGSDVAFAVDAAWLDDLLRALEPWAPVARVEPAPLAVVAGLPAGTSGTWTMDAAPDETGLLEAKLGRLTTVRRVPLAVTAPAADVLPDTGGVPGSHLGAWGALRRDDEPLTGSLLSEPQRVAARRRVARGVATAALAAVAGVTFLLVAADRSRERTLAALETEVERLTSVARPALEAQAHLALAQHEAAIVRVSLSERSDPASALAAIGDVLPRDVVILTARATGNDWQIDGTARNAAALVPLLDSRERFDNVRSLAGSSRFRDGNVTRESFSIALHVRPAS